MSRRTEKDMTAIRRTVPFATAIKKDIKSVPLKNYHYNGSTIELRWDMNANARRDKVFSLRIDDKEVLIDLEELLSYTRLM